MSTQGVSHDVHLSKGVAQRAKPEGVLVIEN